MSPRGKNYNNLATETQAMSCWSPQIALYCSKDFRQSKGNPSRGVF